MRTCGYTYACWIKVGRGFLDGHDLRMNLCYQTHEGSDFSRVDPPAAWVLFSLKDQGVREDLWLSVGKVGREKWVSINSKTDGKCGQE